MLNLQLIANIVFANLLTIDILGLALYVHKKASQKAHKSKKQ